MSKRTAGEELTTEVATNAIMPSLSKLINDLLNRANPVKAELASKAEELEAMANDENLPAAVRQSIRQAKASLAAAEDGADAKTRETIAVAIKHVCNELRIPILLGGGDAPRAARASGGGRGAGGENEAWLLDYLKSHPKQGRGPILKAAESAGKNQGSIGLLLVKLAKDGKIVGVLPAGASRGLLYSLA